MVVFLLVVWCGRIVAWRAAGRKWDACIFTAHAGNDNFHAVPGAP